MSLKLKFKVKKIKTKNKIETKNKIKRSTGIRKNP